MLQTKNLCKSYKPKKGVPVKAVDDVSIRFPEKGMVFLLGKSGSGKSTMLNLLGGLDKYDSGEIIIKGISSKNFNQQRFDSYRNTYVGFIFQEYNVLEEFTVGANIALAIELQGRKAEDEQINEILKEVDLEGYGERNPNELSGGQKQRVAIARALVKNPEIIMADEPTGALDSNTGRQVFDTLKKLSKEKLVIIVSHDRDYAEQYADRIIEMADGKVIRDVQATDKKDEEEQGLVFRTNTIEVPCGYHLTDEDRNRINEYIDKVRHGLTLTLSDSSKNFKETDESSIPEFSGDDFKLIKSRLPMKSAFRIGSSSLKVKKFRLVMTILLSVVAFSLFTMVDTFSSYDHIRSCVDSLVDSKVNYISLGKEEKYTNPVESRWAPSSSGLSEEDLDNIKRETGISVTGIYSPLYADFDFSSNLDVSKLSDSDYSATTLTEFCGFAEITKESLSKMGYEIYAGNLPDGSKNEIAISLMAAESFKRLGYIKADPQKDQDDFFDKPDETKEHNVQEITDAHYMIGKTLLIGNELYTVTCIVDTSYDESRFERLNSKTRTSGSDMLVNYLLRSEYDYTVNYSLTGAIMVGEGRLGRFLEEKPLVFEAANGYLSYMSLPDEMDDKVAVYETANYTTLENVSEDDVIWVGEPVSELADNEIIITFDSVQIFGMNSMGMYSRHKEASKEELEKTINTIRGLGGLKANYYNFGSSELSDYNGKEVKIVGCFKSNTVMDKANVTVIPDRIFNTVVGDTDGVYFCAVGEMPHKKADIENMVRYCYRDGDDVKIRYSLNNAVTYELDTFNSIIKTLSGVFFYIGIFFAVFASILMANFISVSISYKKQEIGILRAIGSRSNDVFRIFFSESFIIAMIEFVLTTLLCIIGVILINSALRNRIDILITLLHFGPRQILLTLLISVGVAALASFIPVRKIASKKPIDAIRNK